MTWIQKEITLRARSRGFHLVTREILAELPELREFTVGLLNVFIQHTSASLGINENADPDVRVDLEMAFSKIAPEDFPYVHTLEGPDDMPAHIKAAMIGSSLSIPITDGQLNLGIWQGIYLCEHRNHASGRRLVLTLQGERGQVFTTCFTKKGGPQHGPPFSTFVGCSFECATTGPAAALEVEAA